MKNQINNPLISIVIPSFNQGQYIEQTITSILGQNYLNKEIIVIDGGSTDNTDSIIQKYIDSISYYVSEPDNGQADAINKGFRVAKGDVFAWLNSDDMYLPCTLDKVSNILGRTDEPTLLYGGCLHFSEGNTFTYAYLPDEFEPEKLKYENHMVQPSTFWSRKLWEKVGELNESYNYVLDWDWFIRASQVCNFIPVKDYLSVYRFHEAHKTGTGKTSTGYTKRAKEIIQVVESYADEDWIAVYRRLYELAPSMKARISFLTKMRLYRFRQLYYPSLYLKFGKKTVETALQMLVG